MPLVVWTPRPCWGDPYRPHKEGLLPYFQHCTEPHYINGGLKINDLFLWNKCLFYLWIYKPDCHIWESSKHQVHSWLNKQLLLGPRGTECNLSICQDRYRRECCAQGESCCRDRKSPGQVGNERSRATLISGTSEKPVVKAELDENSRCRAHINDKINGKAMGTSTVRFMEPGHTRY